VAPPRIIINAVEGWGKTTAAANIPGVALLMANSETGYHVLRNAGLVPQIDTAESETWTQTIATVEAMISGPKTHDALALDALNGFERQCQEHVCHTQFDDNWGEKGFGSYQKGYELSAIEFVKLLARLDALRSKHNMMIVLLSHCKIRPFKNPEGPDYDRYACNVHDKLWDIAKQWADAVFFGNFLTVLSDSKDAAKKKAKMIGGDDRIMYTVRSAAYDAKNRLGMNAEISIPNNPELVWPAIAEAMKGHRNGTTE
jgi:hypothetical protein